MAGEKNKSIVDVFCDENNYPDEDREKVRGFWDYFYDRFYRITRTENALLRNMFLKVAQYIGAGKGSPDEFRMPLPEGKTRSQLYRELVTQAGVSQEFYNAINSSGTEDFDDSSEDSGGPETSRSTGSNVDGGLLELLDDGDVDGSGETEDVPDVREQGSGTKPEAEGDNPPDSGRTEIREVSSIKPA
tara:strand:- start:7389 stop:7952 length:564 start_codon:yes stop_codon:yes gene_type:complete